MTPITMLHCIFRTFTASLTGFRVTALSLAFLGLVITTGCEQQINSTAVIFLNHSGRELEGTVRIRDEGTRFSPFSCTIFPLNFREGDPISTDLKDCFSSELLRHDSVISASRNSKAASSVLYVSIQPNGDVVTDWHNESTSSHAIHAEAMNRLHNLIPVAVQTSGNSYPPIVRVYQSDFQYRCSTTFAGASCCGYLRTDAESTTHLLATYQDDQGLITKFASISDQILQQWLKDGRNGLSVWIDCKKNQATIYPLSTSERDAYFLSQLSVGGGISTLPKPLILPLSQSRAELQNLLVNFNNL